MTLDEATLVCFPLTGVLRRRHAQGAASSGLAVCRAHESEFILGPCFLVYECFRRRTLFWRSFGRHPLSAWCPSLSPFSAVSSLSFAVLCVWPGGHGEGAALKVLLLAQQLMERCMQWLEMRSCYGRGHRIWVCSGKLPLPPALLGQPTVLPAARFSLPAVPGMFVGLGAHPSSTRLAVVPFPRC